MIDFESFIYHFELNSSSIYQCYGFHILQHVGDLGNILADKSGRALFRLEDKNVKVLQMKSFLTQKIINKCKNKVNKETIQ